jgi:Peptidase M66
MKKLAWVFLIAGCNSPRSSTVDSPLVQGLHLSQVASYQTLKSTLMKDGAANDTPEVPVIAGRPLLLRAFVSPDDGWDSREIIVRFEMTANGTPIDPVEVRKAFAGESSESDLDSTANLQLTADQVTPDLTYAVSLHEENPGAAVMNDGAIWPAPDSQASLGAQDTGSGEHIVIIPVEYDADGSGRLPDTGDQMIAALQARMLQLYPVSKVEITVGRPLQWPNAVDPSGRGWGQLLDTIINQRLSDGVADNVYYYGMFAPSDSFEQFCSGGCVLGLSPASSDPNDVYQRGSVGIGYLDSYAESDVTFVHEVGHAHGRQHAPCGGASAPDRKFPYSNGGIGDWGFDTDKMTLLDPAGKDRDMMGYCSPVWISDYNYTALFQRVVYLNSMRGARSLALPNRWRTIVVEDGQAVRTGVVTVAAGGVARSVERVSRAGSDSIVGRFYPFDHIAGGILLVPEDADVGTLKFQGLTIQ